MARANDDRSSRTQRGSRRVAIPRDRRVRGVARQGKTSGTDSTPESTDWPGPRYGPQCGLCWRASRDPIRDAWGLGSFFRGGVRSRLGTAVSKFQSRRRRCVLIPHQDGDGPVQLRRQLAVYGRLSSSEDEAVARARSSASPRGRSSTTHRGFSDTSATCPVDDPSADILGARGPTSACVLHMTEARTANNAITNAIDDLRVVHFSRAEVGHSW